MYPLRVLNKFNPKNSDVRIMGRTFTAQGNPPGFYFKWEKCAGYMFSMLIQKSWDHHNSVNLWDAYFEEKYNDGYLGPERNYGELSFFGSGENLVTIKCNNLTSAVLNGEQLIDSPTEDPNVEVQFSGADPTFYYMSCNGDVTIESSKSGSVVRRTYNDLDRVSVAVEADANTPIKIYGDVTEIYATGSVITDIDVTNCENLITLGAQGSTFAHIDLTQNALLQTLDLLNNSDLEDLNYTNNPDLTTLKLSNNTHITAIDVTDKTALTTLVLENMPITSLDLTYNTLLETLSVAGCTGIMSLDLQALTALTTLDCSGLPITTLELTNNPLTSLTCTGCSAVATIYAHATISDVATTIAALMTANTGLQGTIYTYSTDAHYSTIKTAALAANWKVLLLNGWLNETTQNAILTAFGNSDGIAVVEATNGYLDALDPTKATALASYIAEDPMLVCSLGLQPTGVTMPIRWLMGGGAYIDSLRKAGANTKIAATFRVTELKSNICLFGSRHDTSFSGNTIYYAYFSSQSRFALGSSNYVTYSSIVPVVGINKVSIEPNKGVLNNNNISIGRLTSNTVHNIFVMGISMGDTLWEYAPNICGISECEITNPYNDSDCMFIPCKNPSGEDYGVLDIKNMQWYANQRSKGAFTIAYTLQDGLTPWTPGT